MFNIPSAVDQLIKKNTDSKSGKISSSNPALSAGNAEKAKPLSFAGKWKLLAGESKWNGLLNPVDIFLRQYIIHYGELAQATYDSFNSNKLSKNAGNCLFKESNLFEKVGLRKSSPYKYSITKYIYATSSTRLPLGFMMTSLSRESSDKESNWVCYVAVVSDESKELVGRRDIVITWRGTIGNLEWANDFDHELVSGSSIFPILDSQDTKIHRGFLSLYTSTDSKNSHNQTSARDQVIGEVMRLVELYKDEEISITVTGHSLGGVMATLVAADIAANKANKPLLNPGKPCPVTAVAFGTPKLGDQSFVRMCSKCDELRILRVRNKKDVIPDFPPFGYTDCGVELKIDTSQSPYLKPTQTVADFHNLEGYMHGIAGSQGFVGFKMEIPRFIGLVNKHMDVLKEEYLVPPNWWIMQNKGMVQSDNGTWKLMYDF